jgi:hypothetical protein
MSVLVDFLKAAVESAGGPGAVAGFIGAATFAKLGWDAVRTRDKEVDKLMGESRSRAAQSPTKKSYPARDF